MDPSRIAFVPANPVDQLNVLAEPFAPIGRRHPLPVFRMHRLQEIGRVGQQVVHPPAEDGFVSGVDVDDPVGLQIV